LGGETPPQKETNLVFYELKKKILGIGGEGDEEIAKGCSTGGGRVKKKNFRLRENTGCGVEPSFPILIMVWQYVSKIADERQGGFDRKVSQGNLETCTCEGDE